MSACKAWITERTFLEACLYVLIAILSFVAPYPAVYERPIPYQLLQTAGVTDYVVLDLELNNEYIPDKDASCPISLLIVLSLVIPLLVLSGYSLSFGRRIAGDTHAILCAFLLGLALTEFTTTWLKVYVSPNPTNPHTTLTPNQPAKC